VGPHFKEEPCDLPSSSTSSARRRGANYIRPVSSGWVTATVTPANIGRRSQVWEIRIVDEVGKHVCISRCTIAVLEQRSTDAVAEARGATDRGDSSWSLRWRIKCADQPSGSLGGVRAGNARLDGEECE